MNSYLYSQIIKIIYEAYFDTKIKKHKPKMHFSKNTKKEKKKKIKKNKNKKKYKKTKKSIKKQKKI